MKIEVGLVLVAGLVIESYGATRGPEKKVAKGLEGTWVVVSFTRHGRKDESSNGDKVTFKGKSLTVKTKQGEQKGAFQIDPKTKTIDITVKDHGREETARGIFRLNGDDLTICFSRRGQDRPKEFTAEDGSRNTLIVLKRDKSK
jgi:uncharacterized protein (TIGR03067 family)